MYLRYEPISSQIHFSVSSRLNPCSSQSLAVVRKNTSMGERARKFLRMAGLLEQRPEALPETGACDHVSIFQRCKVC